MVTTAHDQREPRHPVFRTLLIRFRNGTLSIVVTVLGIILLRLGNTVLSTHTILLDTRTIAQALYFDQFGALFAAQPILLPLVFIIGALWIITFALAHNRSAARSHQVGCIAAASYDTPTPYPAKTLIYASIWVAYSVARFGAQSMFERS